MKRLLILLSLIPMVAGCKEPEPIINQPNQLEVYLDEFFKSEQRLSDIKMKMEKANERYRAIELKRERKIDSICDHEWKNSDYNLVGSTIVLKTAFGELDLERRRIPVEVCKLCRILRLKESQQ